MDHAPSTIGRAPGVSEIRAMAPDWPGSMPRMMRLKGSAGFGR